MEQSGYKHNNNIFEEIATERRNQQYDEGDNADGEEENDGVEALKHQMMFNGRNKRPGRETKKKEHILS